MKLASLLCAGIATLALALPALAQSPTGVWLHGDSLVETPKYPEGFAHFDYVNPEAPKGGTVRIGSRGSFDTFNPLLPQGQPAGGLGLVYETLMIDSLDEASTHYGLLAEAMMVAEDYGSVTFRMNPDARWHDGEPVTAEDVLWSFNKLIELDPDMAGYYADVEGVAVSAPGEVTFTFNTTENDELPHILGQVLVLPQHWWEGTDAEGNQRDISRSTLEPPMGSGPYEVSDFEAGRTMVYQRVEDYWGVDHSTRIGTNNFDTYRIEFFLDETVQFEAFKADQFDWWFENVARRWATQYNFPAVEDGRIVLERFPQGYNSSGAMVGFIPNLRRPMFQDERVREALNYAFDFEQLNTTLFYGEYQRVNSYFFGLPFASTGLPQGEELAILESVREQVPPAVFTETYANPVAGDDASLRENLRTALGLLGEAGYTLNGNQLVDANGQQLAFEILLNGPTIEPVAQNLVDNLALIGVAASLRIVDGAQYVERVRTFDYDMIYTGWSQSFSPGNEQRFFFGSSTADQEGSRNYAGIADPGIDALIELLVEPDDRETQLAITSALDRVLLHHHYVVPSYMAQNERIARWDRFSHPEPLPEFSVGFPTIWWWDADKAAKVGGGQ